ncbi:Glutathione S-transferase hmp2 [Metarhizium brunneum]|uniref:glutathione transferase n=1 Tax=Metarhizium brunneum TaxID=500148 RepID=A0A7D5Z4N8_9HYPO|nr:Glutathione S-transferase hmp2 [Metarhizium brunneum]
MAKVAQAGTDLDNILSEYNAILAKQKYLAADTISLADSFHLPNAKAMKAFGYHLTFEKYSNVDEWLAGLENRETWIRATAEASGKPN